MINKEPEVLMDKICRSCMCETEEHMKNVFESKGQTLQISEMLMACAAIQVIFLVNINYLFVQ